MAVAGLPAALGVVDIVALVRERRASCTEILQECLRRIEGTDATLRAWEFVDAGRALEASRALDAALSARAHAPGLAGVPVGIKDIIDVAGLPTRAGFTPFARRVAATDADVVASLRDCGAVVAGKTVTAQLAYADPPVTLNPLAPERSPGGSSSGSAVAVAAGHVPAALGTQTAGSVLRPAAFTGCVGFKPSFGVLSTRGCFPLAWSLDHVGVITRSVADCRLVFGACARAAPTATMRSAPRLGLVSAAVELASADIREATARAAAALVGSGAQVTPIELGVSLDEVWAAHQVIMQSEAAAVHRHLLARHRDHYQPKLRAFLELAERIPAATYVNAQRLRSCARKRFAHSAMAVDALVLPTVSAFPADRSSTGDSMLQALFTATGMPSITIPLERSDEGLRHALQLAASHGRDGQLLAVAEWCEVVLLALSQAAR
ncbi:MAG TPA: amidase [Candidatus Dormibacteraeota bacterium]